MYKQIINLLKKIFPPSRNVYEIGINRVVLELEGQGKSFRQRLEYQEREFNQKFCDLMERQKCILDKQTCIEDRQRQFLEKLQYIEEHQVESINKLLVFRETEKKINETYILQEQLLNNIVRLKENLEGFEEIYSSTLRRQENIMGLLSKDITKLEENIDLEYRELIMKMERIYANVVESRKFASESVWGHIFNNTISNSLWLKDKTFSPGRWAMGYQGLYLIYRILNEARPQNILELGLGQSTFLINQYVEFNQDVSHTIVENDMKWVDFFTQTNKISERTNFKIMDYEYVGFKEAEKIRRFKNFKNEMCEQKYDFIIVDAPTGGDMKIYSRIDILDLLPQSISERFILLIDDCNRTGEMKTVGEIERILKDADISYEKGKYSGVTDSIIICSNKMKFLVSM